MKEGREVERREGRKDEKKEISKGGRTKDEGRYE